MYPGGDHAVILPGPRVEYNRPQLFRHDPGLLGPIPNWPTRVRYAVNLELTQSLLTCVTPRLGLPIKRLDYKKGDKIILWVGDHVSACLTPVPMSNTAFFFYDAKQDTLVTDNRASVDASHLLGKEPHPGRYHVFYVAVTHGTLAFGPENSLMTSPAFFDKASFSR